VTTALTLIDFSVSVAIGAEALIPLLAGRVLVVKARFLPTECFLIKNAPADGLIELQR